MPRQEIEVAITGKDDQVIKVKVRERKIRELEVMAAEIAPAVDSVLNSDTSLDIKAAFTEVLYDKLPQLFPPLTAEDIKEAYPSEIEALGEAFLDVNFFALKRLLPVLISLVQAGLKNRM